MTYRVNTRNKRIPIYVGGKAVYHVSGPALTKSFADNHILRKPPGIGVDIAVLDEAEALGADRMVFTHKETGNVYVCGLKFFREYAVHFDRGWGKQAALPLDYWSIDGQAPRRRPRAVIEREQAEARQQQQEAEKERKRHTPAQMSLFEVAG